MDLPFQLETKIEEQICADVAWQQGVIWGQPRPGHSEGQVIYHIAEVLKNTDRLARTDEDRRALRLIALIHDSFKYRVDPTKPRFGNNHHATLARLFAERYLDDSAILDIIELHDEAFNAWRMGASKGRWNEAEARAEKLVARLGSSLPRYVLFFRADNQTGSKEPDSLIWFEDFLRTQGVGLPPDTM